MGLSFDLVIATDVLGSNDLLQFYSLLRPDRAHDMEFEWHRLVSWVNVTEQWPYRASFLIVFAEDNDASLDEKVTLKSIYDQVFTKLTANDPLLQVTGPPVEKDVNVYN